MSPLDPFPAEPSHLLPGTLLDWAAFLLLLIGGLNLGLHAVLGVDAVGSILGDSGLASRVLDGLIGCAALYGMVRAVHSGQPL